MRSVAVSRTCSLLALTLAQCVSDLRHNELFRVNAVYFDNHEHSMWRRLEGH